MENVNSNSSTSTTSTVVHVEFKRPHLQKQLSLIPAIWGNQVRKIKISEHKEAGHSLAQSFATDDLSQYLLSSDDMAHLSAETKWRLHVEIMNGIVASHCYDGVVTTIGPDYDGVALWMPPGSVDNGWLTMFRSGMWRLLFKLSVEGQRRYYKELLPLLHHTKAEVMGARDSECYYLVYIGTKPSGQRRGYARKLIEHTASQADAEGRAMYLESSSEKNNAYYSKFGFVAVREICMGEPSAATGLAPVRMSIMVREPQKLTKSIPIKLSAGVKRL